MIMMKKDLAIPSFITQIPRVDDNKLNLLKSFFSKMKNRQRTLEIKFLIQNHL